MKMLRWFVVRAVTVFAVSATTLTARAAVKVQVSALLFAERFNESADQVLLRDGAKYGPDGSGVSGQPADRCYVGEVPNFVDPASGPVALVNVLLPVRGLEEMTITCWYKPGERQALDASLFDLASMYLIAKTNGTWVLRVAATDIPKGTLYWFESGDDGPYAGWLQPNDWVFLAVVWKKSASEVCFYQGGKSGRVQKALCKTRNVSVGALGERGDRSQRPDVIGNTMQTKYHRPFNGSIDDLRVYAKALNETALEQIRQADVNNELPPEF
ncbi:MAG TPA: LamG-like jellyroll fold domain-containing protein [Verrucomicrobiae bacterium]|nr:LamG-like jellyroll fold domain-containing protein [Verrucomicrobiae bacterium]